MLGRPVTRREFLCLAAIGAGTTLLAACAPSTPQAKPTAAPVNTSAPVAEPTKPPATAAPAKQVVVTFWQPDWGKDWNDPMMRISDIWSKEVAPNVKVEWTFLPGISDKLVAAVAAGNPPDSCNVEEDHGVPRLARLGGLLSLDKYYKKDGVKGEDFIPWTWWTVTYKGEPFAVPGGCNTTILHYVKEVVAEIGLGPDLPDPPKWADFAEWNRKLLKRDANGKITRIGLAPGAGVLTRDWGGICGVKLYNNDLTQVLLDSEETINALETYVKLFPQDVPIDDYGTFLSGAPDMAYGSWGSGMVGFMTECYSGYFLFDMYWPDLHYGQAKLPTPNGTKDEWSLYSGWVWDLAIPKGSQHPDEAWQFLKYGFWEHGEYVADTINWTSSLKAKDAFMKHVIDVVGKNNRQIPYLHHFEEVMYAGRYYVPWTPVFSQMNDALGRAGDQVVRRMKTAKEALAEAKATVQAELDKANKENWR